ncbi:macro domain-containing protein [Balneatrix alpica]|uniref:macro domain-containing protein n=1 Tax=Balneatrix alpica TaxID=75684 RepID=UPI002739EE17|nr:macro domain-containing protein [Balneatrix alpica]
MELLRACTQRLVVKVGDITRERVDAIINAANPSLLGGGGVDGAIHAAGGPVILSACQRLRQTRYPHGLPVGEAVVTPGGSLPAPFVIHTVGPIYHQAGAKAPLLLAQCYRNSIKLALSRQLLLLAFPAISTGVYGYPREQAAQVVGAVLQEQLNLHPELQELRLLFLREEDARVFIAHAGLNH